MRRRLPVYFVVDLSFSMGDSGADVIIKNALRKTVAGLVTNPMAIETLHLSIIGFNDSAFVIKPLTPIVDFVVPELFCGGFTSLGAGLSLLSKQIRNEVRPNTSSCKGDWRPIIYVLSDGVATDSVRNGLVDLSRGNTGLIYACGIGPNASHEELMLVTENIVMLSKGDSLEDYFEWVSESLTTNSIQLSTSGSYSDVKPSMARFEALTGE